ncbi:MAG: threonine ammonia-lyase [Gammaproteobacteria bacterium]|nr:threonine ammonia-lyase [Gammaproteobacteria bacterium]
MDNNTRGLLQSDPADTVTLDDVRAAAGRLAGHIEHTPCRRSVTLSAIAGIETWLKFENLQFTASFKERGSYNKLTSLGAAEKQRGVIAMSAGNHAQAVAYHANQLGIPATIVMPRNTPTVKVENTKAHGAHVVLEGDNLTDARAAAQALETERNLTFIHPYDDPLIIAGQGTIALEMLDDAPEIDCLVVPVGGGGLISGIAVAAKSLRPDIEVIGVEAEMYSAMKCALDGQQRDIGGDTLAEGIAVPGTGQFTLPLVKRYVDDLLLVDELYLERAVALLLNIEKTLVEGAGAAGFAALLACPERFAGKRVGTVLSGGNIDSRLLASLLLRELVRANRITRLRITIADVPGELAKVSQIVAQLGGNFIEVQHQRIFTRLPAKDSYLDVTLETRDRAHLDAILRELADAHYVVRLLDADESS